MKYLITALLVIFLSGCVGPLLFSNKREVYDISDISISKYDRGFISNIEDFEGRTNYTKNIIVERWGEPDKIEYSEGSERWVYNTGRYKWNGFGIAPIPIPFIIPTGKGKCIISFDNDVMSAAECDWVGMSGALLGIAMTDNIYIGAYYFTKDDKFGGWMWPKGAFD